MNISIGPANADELTEILKIEKDSFPKPWIREQFAECLDSENKRICVARAGTKIAGYIVFEHVVDEGYISNLAVKRDLRGKGIGKKLFEHALAHAKRMGLKWIELEVRESNNAARGFYADLGFIDVRRRKKYYTTPDEDAIVMKLELEQKGRKK